MNRLIGHSERELSFDSFLPSFRFLPFSISLLCCAKTNQYSRPTGLGWCDSQSCCTAASAEKSFSLSFSYGNPLESTSTNIEVGGGGGDSISSSSSFFSLLSYFEKRKASRVLPSVKSSSCECVCMWLVRVCPWIIMWTSIGRSLLHTNTHTESRGRKKKDTKRTNEVDEREKEKRG